MDDFEDLEIDRDSVNSELRYLTLELMKISVKKGVPFKEVAKEFIENVYYMKGLINEIEEEAKKEYDKHERKHSKSNKPY